MAGGMIAFVADSNDGGDPNAEAVSGRVDVPQPDP